jgi:hypothetical protein
MDWSNPIVYELGLTILVAVGFWVWQTVDLRRAARELKEKEDAELRSDQPSIARSDARL